MNPDGSDRPRRLRLIAAAASSLSERSVCFRDPPIGPRLNRLIGADLWPGADLSINLACGFLVWLAGAMSEVRPLAAIVFALLAAMPSIASYFVKTHRDRYYDQEWRGILLYGASLSRIVVAMICLAIVGLSFIFNGL